MKGANCKNKQKNESRKKISPVCDTRMNHSLTMSTSSESITHTFPVDAANSHWKFLTFARNRRWIPSSCDVMFHYPATHKSLSEWQMTNRKFCFRHDKIRRKGKQLWKILSTAWKGLCESISNKFPSFSSLKHLTRLNWVYRSALIGFMFGCERH